MTAPQTDRGKDPVEPGASGTELNPLPTVVPGSKREKRLQAREERKRRAEVAQRQAKLRRTILIVVLVLLLAAVSVAAAVTSLFGLLAPSVGQAMPLLPADHVAEGTPIEYNSRPPTSGPHFGSPYPTYGVVEQEIQPGYWVHNLEHGAVAIAYNCPQGCPELVNQLRQFYNGLPRGRNSRRTPGARLLVFPYQDMDSKISVVAWGYLLQLDEWDQAKVQRFYDARVDRGPECQNLVCPEP